jgi:hypothetical protein
MNATLRTLNTLGLAICGFGIGFFYLAMIDLFIFDGRELAYMAAGFLFNYDIGKQLQTLMILFTTMALIMLPRDY